VVSQLLTLYTTPVVYLELDRLRLAVQRIRRGRARGAVVQARHA
jgi:multidrug efflux pump